MKKRLSQNDSQESEEAASFVYDKLKSSPQGIPSCAAGTFHIPQEYFICGTQISYRHSVSIFHQKEAVSCDS
jgi:hypothetical protein